MKVSRIAVCQLALDQFAPVEAAPGVGARPLAGDERLDVIEFTGLNRPLKKCPSKQPRLCLRRLSTGWIRISSPWQP
ncbi:hypothetical protein, partial [Tepidicella xavieri]|uniref:hypothetical protein n=1 Tax=Tepidicella xavieri TaxID=360241 RepID=UPI001FE36EF8